METLPLPLEVAQTIFAFCLEDDPLHPEKAPLLLTKVCREWRRVVLATPTLWNNLHIPVTHRVHIIPTLRSWLDHAQPLPVDFSVNFRQRFLYVYLQDSPVSLDSQNSYLRVLCAHAQRWRKVSIDLDYEESLDNLSRLLQPGALHNLRELRVRLQACIGASFEELDQHPGWALFAVLNSCELLHTVAWEDNGGMEFLSSLSSHSIRCLTIDLNLENHLRQPFRVSTLERCLSQCPNLNSLTVRLTSISDAMIISDSDSSTPLLMTRIHTLYLSTSNFNVLASLLVRMRFPCLEDLRLYVGAESDTSQLAHHLHHLFLDNSSSLKKVELDSDGIISHPRIIPALTGLHNLTSLVFDEIYNPVLLIDLFKSLTLKFSPSGRLLTSQNVVLEHISLEVHYTTVIDALNVNPETAQPMMEDVFMTMVELVLSRWKLPIDAVSFEGREVRPLVSFEVGQFFVNVFKHHYPKIWPESWPVVAQGWKEIEGIVRLPQLEYEL